MLHIDPVDGLSSETARDAAVDAGIHDRALDGVADMLVQLYRCFTEGDCDLAEINPLILTPDGGVHALDAKVSLDDNAAFRHPEWDEFRATEELDEREQLARTARPAVHRARRLRSASSPTAPGWRCRRSTSSTRSAARPPTSSTSVAAPTPT